MKYLKALVILVFVTVLGFGVHFFKVKSPAAKVSLIGIGFPKCGTTYLFHFLESNPNVHYMRRPYDLKNLVTSSEINFFGNLSKQSYVKLGLREEGVKKKFRPPLKFYNSLIDKEKINIEKSPQYIWKRKSLEEIYKYNPNVKIVVQIRNPIDWLYSYYLHAKKHFKEPGISEDISFEEFLKWPCPNDKSVTVLESGRFVKYLENVFDVFPKENVIILIHEKLGNFKTMSSICDALSLPYPEEVVDLETSFKNPPHYKDKVSPELYSFLLDYYKPYNEKLYELCNERFWD